MQQFIIYLIVTIDDKSICLSDINECATGSENCDVNAVCTNTDGSFTCTCQSGYAGDGVTCHKNGKIIKSSIDPF